MAPAADAPRARERAWQRLAHCWVPGPPRVTDRGQTWPFRLSSCLTQKVVPESIASLEKEPRNPLSLRLLLQSWAAFPGRALGNISPQVRGARKCPKATDPLSPSWGPKEGFPRCPQECPLSQREDILSVTVQVTTGRGDVTQSRGLKSRGTGQTGVPAATVDGLPWGTEEGRVVCLNVCVKMRSPGGPVFTAKVGDRGRSE